MKHNKKLNIGLTIGIVVCILAAFIISVAAKIYSNNASDYPPGVEFTDHIKPNWAAAAPFLVLSVIGLTLCLIKMVKFIQANKSNMKSNKAAIAALIVEIAFVIAAIFACISLALLPTIQYLIDHLDEYEKFMLGTLKCVAPIVTSALALVFAGVDCGISLAKLDK